MSSNTIKLPSSKTSQPKKRAYDGASRRQRWAKWLTNGASANSEISLGLSTLRNRARDLVRNNPYAARIVSVIPANVVGRGIMPNIRGRDEVQREVLLALWKEFAEALTLDFDECLDFYGMQALIMRAVPESGDILIRRRRVSPSSGFPLRLQVLESDHLARDKTLTAPSGNKIVMGVEIDSNGTPVAYHLYPNHPGSTEIEDIRTSFDTIRVPAGDIAHVFKKDRPGQVRGVTWFAPVMARLRELDEFENAMLVKQKVSACFSAFVYDIEAPIDATGEDQELAIERLEPGIIEYLPSGKDIKFATPPMPAQGTYETYIDNVLHSIAAGVGVSFEALTGNYSEVNYSSARMGWLEFGRNIDSWRKHMLIPQFCDKVFKWFLEAAAIMGYDTEGAAVSWTPPRRELLDPTKEIPANISAIRSGISTLSDVIRQIGGHPSDQFLEIKSDNDMIDSLGLVLDSDTRKVNQAGTLQVNQDFLE